MLLFDQSTTQKQGNFVGAEYTLIGTIEEVEPNLSQQDVNAGLPEVAQLKGSLTQASVRLGLRLVHTGTGEVLAAGTGHGVMKTAGVGLSVNVQGGNLGFSAKSKTPIGFAFNAALYQSIANLAEKLKTSPWSCRVAGTTTHEFFLSKVLTYQKGYGLYLSLKKWRYERCKYIIGYDEEENGTATVLSVQSKGCCSTQRR